MAALTVVIVSWNVRDMLRRCVQAVEASLAHSTIPHTIVVVDNASTDGTASMLRAEFPHVRLIEAGCNLGFAGGNNLALHAIEPTTPADAVLLLNPDTEPVGDAIPRLYHYLQTHPQVAAVGPQLRFADGTVQSSRRRFPTRLVFFWESTPLERLWPRNPWARHYHCRGPHDQDDAQEQPVEWLVGAALLVRAAVIQRAGLLDERFFLYSEELEWQRRFDAPIVYLPSAVVVHHEGKSSEQVPAARHQHFQQSKLLLAHMLYGAGFAALLARFLWLCYLWELGVETLKHLAGYRRPLRQARMRAYAHVLLHLAPPQQARADDALPGELDMNTKDKTLETSL